MTKKVTFKVIRKFDNNCIKFVILLTKNYTRSEIEDFIKELRKIILKYYELEFIKKIYINIDVGHNDREFICYCLRDFSYRLHKLCDVLVKPIKMFLY